MLLVVMICARYSDHYQSLVNGVECVRPKSDNSFKNKEYDSKRVPGRGKFITLVN